MSKIRSVLMVLLMLAVAGGVSAETVRKEFQVGSGGALVFDLRAGGEISVTGWSGDTV